jgi:4-alpha-glucanotransferase
MRFPRASGVLLHPTSLPGPHGSGDLGPAAFHFVDWLVGAGQKLWQILPLSGIGPGNSPYMSTSAFAGNVLLVDLAELQAQGWLGAGDLAVPLSTGTTGATSAMSGPSDPHAIDFGAVVPWRLEHLARSAARFAAAGTAAQRADFEAFCAEQAAWLDTYALFMALTEAHGAQDWSHWPKALALREPRALADAGTAHAARIAFFKFGQWRFFRQWGKLRRYANERGVQIVGDTPIFIAHHSAEVWARPELFELDAAGRPTVVAGVPPDAFSDTGQRWGNPLYRWAAHEREGFAWWIERVRRTFELVDLVRIDHFRGFAGYWEIPAAEPTAIKGRWVPAPGARLFEAIERALGTLPIIAEDLGVITPDVVELRHRCGFPGMRILQFAFGSGSGNAFLPHNHEPDTVVYTGTHDNDTTRGWWAGAPEHERHHLRELFATDGREIHWDLIRAALASVADTAIVPLQDVLGLGPEARMNFPGKGEGWWRWRFSWDQVRPEHAQRLAHLTRLYRRDGTPIAQG